jgi:hypothetical protein
MAVMQGLAMTKGIHVGNDKDFSVHAQKYMTPQIPSCISKIMATNNFERLVPWSWLIQNGLQLEYHAWLGILGFK